MTVRKLIQRSLRFHWRSHLGVVLGAAIGSAALIGAFIVGESVRETLRERALERLGWVDVAMDCGDRTVSRNYFLGGHIALTNTFRDTGFGVPVGFQSHEQAILQLRGTMSRQDGTARANHVQVLGISSQDFSQRTKPSQIIPPDAVVLNEELARQLHAQPGDEVILRVSKPSALSRDIVLTPQSDSVVNWRLKVHVVTSVRRLGNFSLRQNQVPPLNALVDLDQLNRKLGQEGRVNLLLSGAYEYSDLTKFGRWLAGRGSGGRTIGRGLSSIGVNLSKNYRLASSQTAKELTARIKPDLLFEAAGLKTARPVEGVVELNSSRIFIEPAVVQVATNAVRDLFGDSLTPVLTYLVNSLRAGTNLTPYSMVTAAGSPYTPPDMKDDEIIVNEWLAEDLSLQPGMELTLTYFAADSVANLVEHTNRFRVRAIVPIAGAHGDRSLMPAFPGIAKAESTQEWDAGFPLTHKIRPKDDAYWKQHRGTPKAFVSLAAGQRMWGNRFGNVTALRWSYPNHPFGLDPATHLASRVKAALKPAMLGLEFQPVRESALNAAEQSQDFGGLFIGFSFFLILAALVLMGLLFAFSVQQRAAEIGTLLAVGFTPKQVRKIFLLEGAALAFIGSVVGVIGGIVYARAMLHGLTTVWRSATNTSALTFHASPRTISIGLISAVLVGAITIWLVMRKQARQPARALLAGDWKIEPGESPSGKSGTRIARPSMWRRLFSARWIAWSCFALAIATVVSAYATHETSNPEYFFSAGTFALIAGLAFASWILQRLVGRVAPRAPTDDAESGARGATRPTLTFGSLASRGTARRRTRSVATVALLASGVFLIVSIGAFRLDANADAWKRSSGTGGFALIGESTLPIVKDLNTKEGRDALGLDEKILADVKFVPFRVREGDDASCLNLNRAQQPRLLGVNAALLADRKAFTFANRSSWSSLRGADVVGDAASIQWALGKKIGDTLAYHDERGNNFAVRLVGGLANSILQGSLVVDEAEFTRRFPGISGYRMFLIDCPSNAVPQVSAELTRALQDYGFEVTPAAKRLAQFNAVQNTYLNTFQVLGGLGLLLGSFGLGIVVLRNVLERRGELALLVAVGFRPARVQKLVLAEHAALLCLGLVIGIVSALVAILPSLLSPRAELPVQSLGLTLGGVLLFGMLATWLATRAAVKGNLLEGLRNE